MVDDRFCSDWSREARTGFHTRRYDTEGGTYDVTVAVPAMPASPDGFALLVVMDGTMHFDAVAAAARALAPRSAKTDIGPIVVLGIASGSDWSHDPARRERDLVPDGAGADALHDLLHSRLLPDVAALTTIDPARRSIMGHSFGGLFALDALARHPSDFSTCITISPSIWRAPELPSRVTAAIGDRALRILMVWGEREPQAQADLPEVVDTLLAAGAQVDQEQFAREDHGSIPFAALPKALRFVHGVTR